MSKRDFIAISILYLIASVAIAFFFTMSNLNVKTLTFIFLIKRVNKIK